MATPKQMIKSFIDRTSVEALLETIADICREKAEQAAAKYQDAETQRIWMQQSRSVAYTATLAKNRGL